jgi:hypothetical protein
VTGGTTCNATDLSSTGEIGAFPFIVVSGRVMGVPAKGDGDEQEEEELLVPEVLVGLASEPCLLRKASGGRHKGESTGVYCPASRQR